MEDERIIQLFFTRSESAIGELHNKYGKTCHKLSANILRNIQDADRLRCSCWMRISVNRDKQEALFSCFLHDISDKVRTFMLSIWVEML